MKNKDWLIVKSIYSDNNPIIILKEAILCITPNKDNHLTSLVYLSETNILMVDEPTSSIEGKL
jgi:hypothetical protein